MSTVGLTFTRGPGASTTSPSSRRVRTGPGQCPFAGVNASHHDQYRLQREGQRNLLSRTRRRRDRAIINSSSNNPHITSTSSISQLLAATAAAAAVAEATPSAPPLPMPSTALVNLGQRTTFHHRRRSPGPTAESVPSQGINSSCNNSNSKIT